MSCDFKLNIEKCIHPVCCIQHTFKPSTVVYTIKTYSGSQRSTATDFNRPLQLQCYVARACKYLHTSKNVKRIRCTVSWTSRTLCTYWFDAPQVYIIEYIYTDVFMTESTSVQWRSCTAILHIIICSRTYTYIFKAHISHF